MIFDIPAAVGDTITVLPNNNKSFTPSSTSIIDIVWNVLSWRNHTLAFASVSMVANPGTLIACMPPSPAYTW